MKEEPYKQYFITCGSGEGSTPLNAFDNALLSAKIGHYNLVKVTSIIPPFAERTVVIEALPGTVIHTAFASIDSGVKGEIISSAVAVAIPQDRSLPGLIMEHSGIGRKEEIEIKVRKMAEEGMVLRGYKIARIESIAVEHQVVHIGCALSATLLW
jgi:arginine decarboxylase